MGDTVRTTLRIGRRTFEGDVLLETSEIVIRGEERLVIPFASITGVEAKDGALVVAQKDRRVTIALGARAAKWAEKIAKPKSVVEKLGIKPGQRVTVLRSPDASFAKALAALGADVSESSRPRADSDAIFVGLATAKDLAKIATLAKSLAPAGALWTLRRKGNPATTESAVRAAGIAAGLVDVKVVRFSDTHTAEKFVIPVAKRSR